MPAGAVRLRRRPARADLLGPAGFTAVDVRARAGTVRFDSVAAFVRCQRAASPLAAHVPVDAEAALALGQVRE